VLLFSAGAGILITTVVTTPFIWFAYAKANDGPIFPAPLVAIGLITFPLGILLFPLQIIMMLFEFFRKKLLGIELLFIGIVGGGLAGFLWYSILKTSRITYQEIFFLFGIAILQACVVFGFHLVANKLKIGKFRE
jgi:hypothetical protein